MKQIFGMYPELRKGILDCWIIVGYIVGFTQFNSFFNLSIVLACYMIAGNMLNDFMDIEIWHDQNQYEELYLSGAFFSGKDFSKI